MSINLEGVVSANWRDFPAKEIFPGIRKRTLWQGENDANVQILEIAAGAKFATLDVHSAGPEEVFVVSGVFNDGIHDYPAGSFIHNPAGSAHIPQSGNSIRPFSRQSEDINICPEKGAFINRLLLEISISPHLRQVTSENTAASGNR